MASTYCNDARSKVASGGGRSIGGTTLTVVDGSKYQSTAGVAPSPSAPAKLTIIRWSGSDYSVVTVLKCTGRSGNVLTIDGATDGYADAAVLADDVAMCGPTAGDLEDLQNAAKPLICLGRWGTPTDAAGATGLMTRDTSAPLACVPYKIRIKAPTNPSGAGGGATIQVKVDGSDLLTTAYSLAAGTTTWVTVSSGFALSSIADGASIQPSISAIGGDVRGLIVEVWAKGA